jgi:glycine betaine/proline transport system substrate-binding protein
MKMKRMTRLMLLAAAGWLPLSGFAADDARCATVTQSDPGWTDIAATNALSGTILNALGYRQKVQNLSVALAFQGLKTGQVDVFLGNWMPAQAPVIGKFTADGAIKVLGSNLPAARFTLAVPDYVAAAGVKTSPTCKNLLISSAIKFTALPPGRRLTSV